MSDKLIFDKCVQELIDVHQDYFDDRKRLLDHARIEIKLAKGDVVIEDYSSPEGVDKFFKRSLETAIYLRDKEYAQLTIQNALGSGVSVAKWKDLHFNALLLFVRPETEKKKRGRKESKFKHEKRKYYSYICAIKAALSDQSYSNTWDKYASHVTRLKKPQFTVECIANLLYDKLHAEEAKGILNNYENKKAIKGIIIEGCNRFEIDIDEICRLSELYDPSEED